MVLILDGRICLKSYENCFYEKERLLRASIRLNYATMKVVEQGLNKSIFLEERKA